VPIFIYQAHCLWKNNILIQLPCQSYACGCHQWWHVQSSATTALQELNWELTKLVENGRIFIGNEIQMFG